MTNTLPSSQLWLQLMQAGQRAYASRQFDQAESAFHQATLARPDRMEGWANLGATCLARGEPRDAVAILQQASHRFPGTEAVHLLLINAYADAGEHTNAISVCRAALSLQATADLWNRLGTLQRIQWQLTDAAASFSAALALDPKHQYARVNLATLQILQGDHDHALKALEKILDSNIAADTRAEAERSHKLLVSFKRLGPPLTAAFSEHRFDNAVALLDAGADTFQEDQAVIPFLRNLCTPKEYSLSPSPIAVGLPADWPSIEAHFSLHRGDKPAQYLAGEAARQAAPASPDTAELRQYAQAVTVRRAGTLHALFERHPEAAFRYAHWIILNGVDDRKYQPGHFKLQPNLVAANPSISRTPPECVRGTVRRFYRDLLPQLDHAEARAAAIYVMMARTHSYTDGNGRTARYLLNYELERGGQAPILIPESMRADWTTALRSSYRHESLNQLIDVIHRTRVFTLEYLDELEAARGQGSLQQPSRQYP